ncbi:hypothetical protein RhiirA4_456962 [Rhizophagus irregularis]|uniref:Uncharacterized protein n=1 Tax=Rhizophagus irregularis TaxID=588596 RepID=A0A2I1G8R5_9GLOM|nr:hypothetical protein RhiirA4_456962 [Rhizophagus irregularis]
MKNPYWDNAIDKFPFNANLQDIINQQLALLINPTPYLSRYSLITSTAGTGKSYMIKIITDYLTNNHKSFLLIAPTGVAAQNINGKTITF